jgi:hypothetical protein
MNEQRLPTVSIETALEQIAALSRRVVPLIANFIAPELKHHQNVD